MKVWVVYGDDHDYDMMSQWLVGVFSTAEKAKAAEEHDAFMYEGHLKGRGGPNYSVSEVVIDEVAALE